MKTTSAKIRGLALGLTATVLVTMGVPFATVGTAATPDTTPDIAPATAPGWTKIQPLGTTRLTSVSCGSASMCIAVTEDGIAYQFNGSKWAATAIDKGHYLTAVSCPSTNYCMAVDFDGYYLEYKKGTWSAPKAVPSGKGLSFVTCASAKYCLTSVSGMSGAWTFDGSLWSTFGTAPDMVQDASCSSSGICAMTFFGGRVSTYNGSRWSAPTQISDVGLGAITCAADGSCLALDNNGYAIAFDGKAWGDPFRIVPVRDGTGSLHASCASADFCAAFNFRRVVMREGGQWWSSPERLARADVTSTSCPTETFCVATNVRPGVALYRG